MLFRSVIPQQFTVDNFQNIANPIGYGGVKVGANFHIITGDKNAIRNINRSVERAGLKTKDLVLQPLASAAAVMNDQDLEAGVAIVDIGGGTTDLAIFHEGVLKYTAVIPFGGENITNDIKLGLGVLRTQAEAMKVQYGSALSDETKANMFITIPGLKGLAPKEVSVKTLASIIQARMSEILDFVTFHLKQVGLDNRSLNGGIILTGGGSQLKHLLQLTEFLTGLNARIGIPNEHLSGEFADKLAMPMYSTCIGLILKGYNDYENLNKLSSENFIRVAVEEEVLIQEDVVDNVVDFTQAPDVLEFTTEETITEEEEKVKGVDTTGRNKLKGFLDNIKNNLIDLFKEEDDVRF
mgnify:FL=1